ncbi:MAG: Rne/Rng family ribonuclease [Deltaproteobacteria bacterium]|jgi:ribonuclease G|nr:Rne/Rng family ribonuclease [Deltaproteobacteria bacterium]
MNSELLINYRSYETRVALVENGELVEFQMERGAKGAGLLGNIYKAKVLRILPGLQAAFVDIGLDKAAFLYVDDISCPEREFSRLLGRDGDRPYGDGDQDGQEPGDPPLADSQEFPKVPIESLLSEGEEILVQVSKEPIGQKGARVTTLISIPGRRLVLMPMVSHLGVSRRIEDEDERRRLRDFLEGNALGFGLIARTLAEGATEFEIKAEASFLCQLWEKIANDNKSAQAPALVYQELDATLKAVRDIFTDQVTSLVIDDASQYGKIRAFLSSFAPGLLPALSLYEGTEPLFHHYNIESDLLRALNKKVWLKSGGYVVIDSTEALTVVDVNTGRYVGRHNLEETILKTNLEAVREIAYQLRLRNLGGIIVIDFIDMEREVNRERVFQALKELLRRDKGKTKVLPMSELGLVEMTRKRTRENIDRLMREPCFYCQGQGFLLSGTSVCHQAFRELELAASDYPGQPLTLKVHCSIRDLILDEGRTELEDLERRLGCTISIKADDQMHVEAYAVETPPEGPGWRKAPRAEHG